MLEKCENWGVKQERGDEYRVAKKKTAVREDK